MLLFELDMNFGARELALDGRRAVHVSVGNRVIFHGLGVPLAARRPVEWPVECPGSSSMLYGPVRAFV